MPISLDLVVPSPEGSFKLSPLLAQAFVHQPCQVISKGTGWTRRCWHCGDNGLTRAAIHFEMKAVSRKFDGTFFNSMSHTHTPCQEQYQTYNRDTPLDRRWKKCSSYLHQQILGPFPLLPLNAMLIFVVVVCGLLDLFIPLARGPPGVTSNFECGGEGGCVPPA